MAADDVDPVVKRGARGVVVGLEHVRPARPAPAGRQFELGMAIVVQPNPITPDERMGLQLGALTIVTGGGAQSLHEVPFEPIVVEV